MQLLEERLTRLGPLSNIAAPADHYSGSSEADVVRSIASSVHKGANLE